MGLCSSAAAVYVYENGAPVLPVTVRKSIRRRDSFRHANIILSNRVAERLHEEWRFSRTIQHGDEDVTSAKYEPHLETIGNAQVDVASLSWGELPESIKARKLREVSVCCDAITNELRRDSTQSENVQKQKSLTILPNLLDDIAELEYSLTEEEDKLPWQALTKSERAQHHGTTLCVISEWNDMMKEAEADGSPSSKHGSQSSRSPGRMMPSNTSFRSVGSSTTQNLHQLTTQNLRPYTMSLDSTTSSAGSGSSVGDSTESTLSRSASEERQLLRQGRRAKRKLSRSMSGKDVLHEIRQTIRTNSSGSKTEKTKGKGAARMKWAALRIAESTRAHLRKQIRKNKNFVRVFVSSTFRDFHAERDYLFQRVFPRLENACAERGILFIPVDLRWGVTTQEALDGEVIKLCLQEVDTCRPFFVAMLGERYGWHVDPSASDNDAGGTLLKESFNVASVTFPWVKKWRDRSATEIEIRHAVLNNPRSKMHSFFFLRDQDSEIVTNATIKSGENNPFMQESDHAKMLQDQLKDGIRSIESKQHRVTDGYKTLEELGQTLFEQLKEAIEQETAGKDTLAAVVAKALGDEPLDSAHASRNETERLVFFRNQAVAQSFRHAYIKDQSLFGKVEEMCGALDNTPLVLVGGPGVGKSALLANLSESSAPQLRDTVSVILYVGGQYQSPTVSEVVVDIVHLVRRAIQQLLDARTRLKKMATKTKSAEAANKSNSSVPRKSSVIRRKASSAVLGPQAHQQPITETDVLDSPLEMLNKLFEEAGHELRSMKKRLLIGLDGLDRVNDAGMQPLSWLPVATPSGVQLVVSLATGEKSIEQSSEASELGTQGSGMQSQTPSKNKMTAVSPHVILGRRIIRMWKVISMRKWNLLEVTPMTQDQARSLVTTYLNLYGKKFDQDQMKLVLSASHTENPLYMVTLLNEIRKFGSFENLGKQLELYLKAEDTTSLFSLVLTRLDEEIGSDIVSTAARVIWVARSGVSEFDLKTILATFTPDEAYDDFRHRTRDIFVNHANLISFVHFSLADAVEDTYLNERHEIESARRIFVTALEKQANSSEVQSTRSSSVSDASSPKRSNIGRVSSRIQLDDWNHDHAVKGDWWYYIRELAFQYSMLEDWTRLSVIVGNLVNFVLFTEFDPELLIRYWRQLRLQHIRPNTVYENSFTEYSKEQAARRCDELEKKEEKEKEDSNQGIETKDSTSDSTIAAVKKNMRRQSAVPSRRRSLAGIDIQMLLDDPLSKAGKILVHEQKYMMTLEMELDLIDNEREVLLKLVRFFQMLGEYRISLEYSKSALLLMEQVPQAFFGVVEVSSIRIEMAQLEIMLHEFDNAMEHLENARLTVTHFLDQHPDDEAVRMMHIVVLGDMANLLKEMHRYDEAMVKYDEALIWTIQYVGPNDIECAVHLNNLANLLMEQHRYDDALLKYERSLEITKLQYSEEHPEVARTLHNIGLCLKHLKSYGEAMDHFMAAAKMMVDALGTYHPEVGIVLNNISVLCCMRARSIRADTEELKQRQTSLYGQAQQAAERSVVIRERSLGKDHPTLAGAYTNLGKIYLLIGNEKLSAQCYERAVAIAGDKLGTNHPLVGRGLAQLGRLASRGGDLENARDKFQRALKSLRLSMGVMNAFTRGVEKNLASIQTKLSRLSNHPIEESQ